MKTETRATDTKARVTLPRTFANSAIIIDHVSETELRIRKARVIPEDEIRFLEESPLVLSDRDRDRFLDLPLGIHAIVVDAIDSKAQSFYQKYQFSPLLDSEFHLFLPISTIRDVLTKTGRVQ